MTSSLQPQVPAVAQPGVAPGVPGDRFAYHEPIPQGQERNTTGTWQSEDGVDLLLPDPEKVFGSPGYNMPPALHNPAAQVASILASIGVVLPFILVPAFIVGIVALFHRQHGIAVGRQQAWAALCVICIGFVLWMSLFLLVYYGA